MKTGIGLFGFVLAVANIAMIVGLAYAVGSIAASTVKTMQGECQKTTYGIEKFVDGNWFCPVAQAQTTKQEG